MKKLVLIILAIFVVSSLLIVSADNDNNQSNNKGNVCKNLTEEACIASINCKAEYEEGIFEKCEKVDNESEIRGNKTRIEFVPWQKRNESECQEGCKCRGAVMSCPTETGKIMTIEAGRSGNIIIITIVKGQDDDEVEDEEEDIKANTTLEIETENETENETGQNKTKLKTKLSNGRKAEIKIMPDTASEKAIERLGELNFTIQLKEILVGNNKTIAYELQADRHFRILGLFKAKAKVKAEINAETGEVIIVKKPWWAFLAREE